MSKNSSQKRTEGGISLSTVILPGPVTCLVPFGHVDDVYTTSDRNAISWSSPSDRQHSFSQQMPRLGARQMRGRIWRVEVRETSDGLRAPPQPSHFSASLRSIKNVPLLIPFNDKHYYEKMSLSNTNVGPAGPELRGGNITLETIMAKTVPSKRATKIICTLGPACTCCVDSPCV